MEKTQYRMMCQAEENHFWFMGMRKITETLLIKFLPKKLNRQILDAGCGTGGAMLFLKKFGEVTGVDISEEALKFCQKRGLANVRYGSIDNLPLGDKLFDLVTSFDVLGQKEVESDKKALAEFNRVLKPGGILILRVAAYNWLLGYHDILVHTKHRYTKGEIEKLLKGANFAPVKISYANSLLFPAIAFKRTLTRNYKTCNSDVYPVSPIVNRLLLLPLMVDSLLIRFWNLPFGLSVFAIAKKLTYF